MLNSISIIGGDMRQIYLANMFLKEKDVFIYGNYSSLLNSRVNNASSLEEAVKKSNIIVCPIPFSKDNVHLYTSTCDKKIHYKELFSYMTPDKYILSGPYSKEVKEYAKANNVNIIDIASTDQFAVLNAVPTAEGVISIMINDSEITLANSKCLILGYGKCGNVIARLLKGFNMDITIAARNTKLMIAGIDGYKTIDIQKDKINLEDYNFVINTVPIEIMNISSIKKLEDYMFIDIANTYDDTNNKFENARGIPGKYSPKTAAKTIFNVILDILNQGGIGNERIKG